MSYINPSYNNPQQRFPQIIPNNVFMNQQNFLVNPFLQYNRLFIENLLCHQLRRITQKNDSQNSNQTFMDMALPGISNENFTQANLLNKIAFNLQNHSNLLTHNNSLWGLCNFNNNFFNSTCSNFINNLKNNFCYTIKNEQNNNVTENKTKRKELFNNILQKSNDDKNIEKANLMNDNDGVSLIDQKENIDKKPRRKKCFLNKKTERYRRKREEDDEIDEKLSSSKSKFSEKSKNSSTSTSVICLENKKNTRKPLKFVDKNMMLGSKEEYEKFFKNDTYTNQYTEVEKNLIEMINNPRRKNKKKQEINIADYYKLSSEKILELNEELKAYVPLYESDLEEVKMEKQHLFMMSNFPEMYKIQNFYLYIKKNLEKKKDIIKNLVISPPEKLYVKQTPQMIKCIWKSEECETNVVQDYLYEVEKIWPTEEYRFSQEFCLELLRVNNLNIEHSIAMIISQDNTFKDLITSKNLAQMKD